MTVQFHLELQLLQEACYPLVMCALVNRHINHCILQRLQLLLCNYCVFHLFFVNRERPESPDDNSIANQRYSSEKLVVQHGNS